MKIIKELNIKDWNGYILKEMINISDIDPECFVINDFKSCRDGSIIFNLSYSEEPTVPHIVFNNIKCIFRKSGIYSYLIFYEKNKNKDMINSYARIINQLGDDIIDDRLEEDDSFKLRTDIMKFKFKTNDDLPYNKKINIPVCVKSLSSIIKRGSTYYPNFKLQNCFYENFLEI